MREGGGGGEGRCKTCLEEERRKRGRSGVEEEGEGMGFKQSGLWMSKSGEMGGRRLDRIEACG